MELRQCLSAVEMVRDRLRYGDFLVYFGRQNVVEQIEEVAAFWEENHQPLRARFLRLNVFYSALGKFMAAPWQAWITYCLPWWFAWYWTLARRLARQIFAQYRNRLNELIPGQLDMLGTVLFRAKRLTEAKEVLSLSAQLAEEQGCPAHEVGLPLIKLCFVELAMALKTEKLPRPSNLLGEAIAAARAPSCDRFQRCRILRDAGKLLNEAGFISEALALLEEASREAQKGGVPTLLSEINGLHARVGPEWEF